MGWGQQSGRPKTAQAFDTLGLTRSRALWGQSGLLAQPGDLGRDHGRRVPAD